MTTSAIRPTSTAGARPSGAAAPRSREIVVAAGGLELSALLTEPAGEPRATVVAVHGGGMRAGYFDGQAHPGVSLLRLGASLGYTMIALDRPGYGRSADRLPSGQALADQAATLRAALVTLRTRHPTGAGVLLLGHSYGGKLALATAAQAGAELLGVDVSGLGHRYAVDAHSALAGPRAHRLHWGPLRLYPPGTFSRAAPLVTPMPDDERREAPRWPELFPEIASRVRVPVRFTFAEHEGWWCHDEASVADLTQMLAAPSVRAERMAHSGHNISLGWTARAYHLRALAFLEECLVRDDLSTPASYEERTPTR